MYHSTIEYRPVKHFSLTFFRKSRWLTHELRSSVNGLPLLRHSLNKPAARGRQPKMSTPIPKKIPNRPKGKPEGDANQVLEPRAGIKPATDCSKTQELSCSDVSTDLASRPSRHPRFRVVFRLTGLSIGANHAVTLYYKIGVRKPLRINPRLVYNPITTPTLRY